MRKLRHNIGFRGIHLQHSNSHLVDIRLADDSLGPAKILELINMPMEFLKKYFCLNASKTQMLTT